MQENFRGGLLPRELELSVAGAADVVLTNTQAQFQCIQFTGLLTGNITIEFPVLEEDAGLIWYLDNETTGAFTLGVKDPLGVTLDLPAGVCTPVMWNGDDMEFADTGTLPEGIPRVAAVSLTAAEILALATTPIELVAAPGAGKYLAFLGAVLLLDHAGDGFLEAADNLEIHYDNEAGAAASALIEMTGFIDQVGDSLIEARPLATALVRAKAAVEDKALVLTNINDNFTDAGTTTSTLRVKTRYTVHSTGWV